MKILAIGDFHGKFPVKLQKLAKEVDLILCTGDFGGSDKLLKVIFKHFNKKWWNVVGKKKAKRYVMEDYNSGKKIIGKLGKLKQKIYTVYGNWDFSATANYQRTIGAKIIPYSKIMGKTKNIIFQNKSFKKIDGLNILFFGGYLPAMAYVQGSNGKVIQNRARRQNKKETDRLMKYVKKDIDILFAHCPPFGVFDKVKFPGKNPMNGKRIGFEGYTKFIEKNKPKLFICGHMHEYQGKKKMGDSLIVTTGAAKDGKCAIIDFDEKKRKVKSVRFVK